MRLRARLILLVIATAVPLVALAVLASYLLVTHEQQNFVRAVQDRNRAFISAVDAELQGHIRALTALTALPNLTQDDLRAVHEDLLAAQHTQPSWIAVILAEPGGRQLVNTLARYGDPLPFSIDPDSVRRCAEAQRPVIAGVRQRKLIDKQGVSVRVPVVRGGKTMYVLTAVVNPEAFRALIEDQHLPTGWVSGLVDAAGKFIARVPARPVGSRASDDFLAATARANEGWYRGSTVEGSDTYTAFVRSELTGWTLGLAIPANVVLEGAYRVALTMSVIALVCVGLAIVIAVGLGRRIAAPIAALAAAAPHLGDAHRPLDVPSEIPEVRDLADALGRASEAIRERARVGELERKVLADSDRAKDEFIAMLSHEMRNPLAALTSAAALLRAATPGSEVLRAAQGVIERQTQQLTRLVEDLLDASRIAMGKAALERHPLDLAEVVAGAVATLRQAGKLREHEVTMELAPAWVNGDRGRLEQVLSNLLDNAVKFTPPGGAIRVRVSDGGGVARVSVEDSGIGIPREELPRVFDLFVQGPQGLSRTRGGIGVGLALVKRLVDMHGGHIAVESAGLDRGTTFVITLPGIPAPVLEPPPRVVAPAHGSLRLLLVEDNPDARTMLAALLVLRGHTVREAGDAAQALHQASSDPPDVALVDIGLPDMDGYALAEAMRARCGAATPVLVALTGYGQPADRARSLSAGFDEHVTKPLTSQELDELLARLVVHRAGTTRQRDAAD